MTEYFEAISDSIIDRGVQLAFFCSFHFIAFQQNIAVNCKNSDSEAGEIMQNAKQKQ